MTDREKAIVMAHTGLCMLTGDKFQIFHKYVDDIMGRPLMTHEIGLFADTIKAKSRNDFIALCNDEPKHGYWIKYNTYFMSVGRPLAGHIIRECSVCHHKIADFTGKMNYCPNCGIAMKDKEKESKSDAE